MKPSLALALALAGCAGCAFDDAPPDPPPDPVPAGCIPNDVRARTTVTVSGTVVDFTTRLPVAGARVELTTAWDVVGNVAAADCPVLGQVTTDASGRFGPIDIHAGSTVNPPLVLFTVHGGDRAVTLSDSRTCAEPTCFLGHTIAAPSRDLGAQWRSELAAGGMTEAATRGLIAFTYKNQGGAPAAGVTPDLGDPAAPLVPGAQVRVVDADRVRLAPVAQTATTVTGVAVIGVSDPGNAVFIGGHRGGESWAGTGSLVVPGAVFVEDRTVSPP